MAKNKGPQTQAKVTTTATTAEQTTETKVLEGELVSGTEGTEADVPSAPELQQTQEKVVDTEAVKAGEAVANEEEVAKGEFGKHEGIPEGTRITEGEEGVASKVIELHPYCETVLEYAKAMGPANQVTPIIVLGKQMELYQAVTGIVNNFEGKEFVQAYSQALEIMAEYPNTFADNMLFRGINQMRVPPAVRQRYENILILMSSTANIEGRKAALEAISLDVLCKDFSNEVEQKLRGFYR